MSWKSDIAKSALKCFLDALGQEAGRLVAVIVLERKDDDEDSKDDEKEKDI